MFLTLFSMAVRLLGSVKAVPVAVPDVTPWSITWRPWCHAARKDRAREKDGGELVVSSRGESYPHSGGGDSGDGVSDGDWDGDGDGLLPEEDRVGAGTVTPPVAGADPFPGSMVGLIKGGRRSRGSRPWPTLP